MHHIKKISMLLAILLTMATTQAQVVFADYSDPDVCEGAEGDYWMTASSFQCSPGLPILHSKDLEHWELVNYAVEGLLPRKHYNSVRHGCGVWAPSIRRHAGTYYIYWGDPDFGVWMVKADNPRGRWSEPTLVMEGKGVIDPCPLWDDDGRCYLVNGWANSRCGFNSVLTVRELSSDGSRVISQPMMVYDGLAEGNYTIEGPKFYKKDGYYYILAPAGGVEHGWQLALRSRNVWGPYESKVVFHQDGIHQGGWVANGFICFQERGAYGRILHLLQVDWKDGWPMMKTRQQQPQPPETTSPPCLKTSHPSLSYQWHANRQDTLGFLTNEGARVYGYPVSETFKNLWDVPNLYLKKFEGETFIDTLRTVITARSVGDESGFVVMGRDYCRLSVEFEGDTFVLKHIVCKNADRGGAEAVRTLTRIEARKYKDGTKTRHQCRIDFRLQCDKGAICHLAYSTDSKHFTPVAEPFAAREGVWIGAKYGVFSLTKQPVPKGWIDLKR